ncbi:hypothetical protein, partial [Nitrosomonas halophila]|uniref:hypothetical protein n=1 Tax=Nitrosomonas halophila TaxID=44576 RepID=UPI001C4092EC
MIDACEPFSISGTRPRASICQCASVPYAKTGNEPIIVDTLSSVKQNLHISALYFEKLVTIKRHVVMQ